MAVVQISKIQVRRGLKNSSLGVPQLSSAEFAWAVDTQELFIGNGSVAEGAPYVGNTKILTENDNILELAGSYRFAAQDPSISYSVQRSLQTKLDEIEVSVVDFGAVGDGSTSNNQAFENAFLDLFRNPDDRYKKVLKIPNGQYLFTSDIKIPSGAIIRGENQQEVVLDLGSNNIVFTTSTGLELASFDAVNRPRNVEISNLTISRTNGQVVLTGLRDSLLKDLTLSGSYTSGDSVTALNLRDSAVFWQNISTKPKTDNIRFESCSFLKLSLGIKCTQDDTAKTEIFFTECHFLENDVGVYIEGTADQITKWEFNNTKFEEIYRQAVYSTEGQGMLFTDCDFFDCGNTTGDSRNPGSPPAPATEIVFFGDFRDNRLINCTSDRHQSYSITNSESRKAYPEVIGASMVNFVNRQYADIRLSASQTPLAVFSVETKYIRIDYTLKLNTHTRSGRLTITLDEDNTSPAITDEFQYSPSFVSSTGGSLMTNFQFGISLKDNDSDTLPDTILLSYENPSTSNDDRGTISYNITYGV